MADNYNLEFANLVRIQQGLTKLCCLKNDKLIQKLNDKNTYIFAQQLAEKYFSKTKNIDMLVEITDLYRYWIVLAPITNKLRQNTRIEHNDNYVLSWIRRNANKNVRRYYLSEKIHQRDIDSAKIIISLEKLGVEIGTYTEQLLEIYENFYINETVMGKMVRRMFDALQFSSDYAEGMKYYKNRQIQLQNNAAPGYTDIRNGYTNFLGCYNLGYQEKTAPGTYYMTIELSQEEITLFKAKIRKIIDSDSNEHKKISELKRLINGSICNWRYAVSGHKQITEIALWLQQLGAFRHNKKLQKHDFPGMLFRGYMENVSKTAPVPDTHNIFYFGTDRINREMWFNMFNPYL